MKSERVLIVKLVKAFPGETLGEIKLKSDFELLATKGVGKKVFQYVKSLSSEKRFNVEQLKHMTYSQRLRMSQHSMIKNMRKAGLYVIAFMFISSTAHAVVGMSALKHLEDLRLKKKHNARTIKKAVVDITKFDKMYGTASYYTKKSCQREGTSGVWTASGEAYNEDAMTCALRRRDWGGEYRVTNIMNGKSVVVRHNDFGPNKTLYNRGRIVDLSRGAFSKIAELKSGIIQIKIEKIK